VDYTSFDSNGENGSFKVRLLASLKLCVVARDDYTDFGLLEIQGQSRDAVAQIDHLVEHRIGQAIDLGDGIANLPNDADILPAGRSSRTGYLQVSHNPKTGAGLKP
jgi:hypothetical protein